MSEFLRLGKRVALPKVKLPERQIESYYINELNDLHPGAFGIMEPDPACCAPALPGELEVIIVPGVGFDRAGRRLGSGHGYYDRFLPQCAATRVGLAFSLQLCETVPSDAHDQRMDFVVTEEEIIAC